MVGYATDETPEMMPKEWVLARDICMRLRELRRDGVLSWLRSDTKSQVTVDPDGVPVAFIVAAQHDGPGACGVSHEEMREMIFDQVVKPILGDSVKRDLTKINGTGSFIIGGPTGDAGVVGRKIVVDAYGPRVPVGGGAYSGKDPTKVDRSAAYMARHLAKAIVAHQVGGAKEALVHLAYGIVQRAVRLIVERMTAGPPTDRVEVQITLKRSASFWSQLRQVNCAKSLFIAVDAVRRASILPNAVQITIHAQEQPIIADRWARIHIALVIQLVLGQ